MTLSLSELQVSHTGRSTLYFNANHFPGGGLYLPVYLEKLCLAKIPAMQAGSIFWVCVSKRSSEEKTVDMVEIDMQVSS